MPRCALCRCFLAPFGLFLEILPGTKLWHPGAHCLPGVQLCASLCRCFLARPPPCPLPRSALSRCFLVTSSWNSDAVLQGATAWCPAQVCIIVEVFSSWTPSWNSTLLITTSTCCCLHTLVHFLYFAYCRATSWRHTLLLCCLHPSDNYRESYIFGGAFCVPIWLSPVPPELYFWQDCDVTPCCAVHFPHIITHYTLLGSVLCPNLA